MGGHSLEEFRAPAGYLGFGARLLNSDANMGDQDLFGCYLFWMGLVLLDFLESGQWD